MSIESEERENMKPNQLDPHSFQGSSPKQRAVTARQRNERVLKKSVVFLRQGICSSRRGPVQTYRRDIGQIALFPEALIGTITANDAARVRTITISCGVFQVGRSLEPRRAQFFRSKHFNELLRSLSPDETPSTIYCHFLSR